MTRRQKRTRRATLGALFILLAAPAAYADGEFSTTDVPAEATASATGLGITPATGNLETVLHLTIPAACPTGSQSVIIQVTNGGFPAGSNILGDTDITGDPAQVEFLPGPWNAIASNNAIAGTALTGKADLKLLCLGDGAIKQDYTGSVTFSGTGSAITYTAGGGGAATPTPSSSPGATSTPTPTPTGSNTPTPRPAETTTPTPEPDADTTPTPEPTDTGTDDQGGAVTDGKTDLPDTGSHAGPMYLLAMMLLCSGIVLLALSIWPWGEDEWSDV